MCLISQSVQDECLCLYYCLSSELKLINETKITIFNELKLFLEACFRLYEEQYCLVFSCIPHSSLSRFTERVTQLIKVLKDLQKGKYETAMVSKEGNLIHCLS